jgi:FHA domain
MHRFGYRFVGEVTEHAVPVVPGAALAPPYLVFEGRQLPLMEGANVIGRERDATIQCAAPGVSRYHARILVAAGEATVEDIGFGAGAEMPVPLPASFRKAGLVWAPALGRAHGRSLAEGVGAGRR